MVTRFAREAVAGGETATGHRLAAWPGLAGGAVIVAITTLIVGFHLGRYGLWEPDESRYAEIAREMLAMHDFVVPHLNYVSYIEKPPLLYWLTVCWMKLFGVNELAARLTPAIAAVGGTLATYVFAMRAMDRRRAFAAGLILATMPLYAVMAQVLTTDLLLTTTVTVATLAFYLHWVEGGRWCWIAYLATAMAVLTKGPVGAVLPCLIMIAFLLWEHDLRGVLRRFHVFAGLAIVIAIAAPWFIYMTLRVPGYFQFYFIGEHLRRFLQSGYSHGEPIYYYVPVIIAGILPWSILAVFLDWRTIRLDAPRRFCLIAAITILVFFSLASAKLIPYVLPALPPIAVILGDAIITTIDNRPRRLLIAMPILGLFGATAAIVAIYAADFRGPYLVPASPALEAIAIIGLVAGAAGAALFFANRYIGELAMGLMALAITLMLIAGTWGRLAVEPLRSYAKLGREVAAAAPNATLVCYKRYVQALPFYAHRRVILAGAQTELSFGASAAPDARQWFFDGRRSSILRLWRRPGSVVVVLDQADLDRLKKDLGPFTVIGSEFKKRAILKSTKARSGN